MTYWPCMLCHDIGGQNCERDEVLVPRQRCERFEGSRVHTFTD
jgi:hypothetical protein